MFLLDHPQRLDRVVCGVVTLHIHLSHQRLRQIVRSIYPFNPGSPSESVFESRLPAIFNTARARREDSPIDISYLRTRPGAAGSTSSAPLMSVWR